MIPVRLVELIEDVEVVATERIDDVIVTDVVQSSTEVRPGALFCCRVGERSDGHRFASEAVRRGAAALLVERPLRLPAAQVVVPNVRAVIGVIAAQAWDHPSRRMRVVGVTGTNGKTTTTHLLGSILEAHGWPTEVSGTLTGPLTTPEPTWLQRRLAGLVADGFEAVAMEVSSHGLDQGRVSATGFAAAVFTNLDRDHLDYHGDLEAYFAAKASLFDPARAEVGVVNADDLWGARLLRSPDVEVLPFAVTGTQLRSGASGTTFRWRGHPVHLRLPGRFNVANALAAATAAEALGVAASTVAAALSEAGGPPGRMEAIEAGQSFRVVVDCAHTPSALEQVLVTLTGRGRLIVVFGCGGDRDRTKRPEMGAIVARHADFGILTADNPRTEAPERIFADVLGGAPALVVEPDRRKAIDLAIGLAGPHDTVLIAGKGDQTVQHIGGTALPFDDRVVTHQLLAVRHRHPTPRPWRPVSRSTWSRLASAPNPGEGNR